MNPTRKILIASYYFPPDSAVGGLRAAKFARLLPEFGWESSVITVVDECRNQGLDQERMKGLEHVTIVRTPGLPTVRGLYLAAKSRLRRLRGTATSVEPPREPLPQLPRRESLKQRLKRYFISLVVMLPDTEKGWSIYAAFSAVRLIRRHKIECVLTSGPPFSAHVIGLIAKLFTNAIWIADFRDPWVEMLAARFPETHSKPSDVIETWMEWSVVKYADRVLTTTERLRQSFVERYPVRPSEKFLCVPNSIDTTRFPLENTEAKYDALTITYAGTLYFDRTPEPLFRAVGALLREGKIGETDIRIKLVGNCRAIDGIDTMVVARRHGVESVVELLDAVPYTDAIRIMQRSHLLLMIAPEAHRLVVGAKLFDYLGSGSKILGLAEDGATADVIADTASGRCFSLSDVAGIREYILELITEKKFQTLKNDVTAFGRYDVRYLSGKLAAELSALRPERLNTAVSWSR